MLLVACKPDRLLAASASWQKWCTNHHLPVAFLPLSGVELDRFRPVGPKIKLELRKKLGFSDRTVILHVGHLRHRRNLAAMKEITKDRSKQVVIVISSALRSDANITEDLQSAGCVVRCGYVPHIEEYYQAADCYVFPTLDPEAAVSVPLSVLEAMATNIPVVTTPFGGLRDLFQSTPGLEFVPSDAMAELPAAVDRVLSIPHVNLRDRVQPHDWNAIGARLVRELRAVVS
ncbi:MAG: glycosyltransferase family 4 protein [Candidatus Korobacteraceae bacterium]|jgi:glycosyltransferase involved in cell wall biosynthesis